MYIIAKMFNKRLFILITAGTLLFAAGCAEPAERLTPIPTTSIPAGTLTPIASSGTPVPGSSIPTGTLTPIVGTGTGNGNPITTVTVNLIAENNVFDKTNIGLYQGETVSIVFENRDNVAHNFSVYERSDAKQVIFKGKELSGPGKIVYTFTPPSAGYFYFQCDFHPLTMNGSFTVIGTES